MKNPKEEQIKCYCRHTTTCDCITEEPKQETLEEAFEKFMNQNFSGQLTLGFVLGAMKFGAKWQQERMYSEEDMRKMYDFGSIGHFTENESLEQFKKK